METPVSWKKKLIFPFSSKNNSSDHPMFAGSIHAVIVK